MAGGATLFRPALTERVRSSYRRAHADSGGAGAAGEVTRREIEILALMAGGLGNAEIGATLGVSEGTVKNHVSSILSKLRVRDRVRAVLRGIELEIVCRDGRRFSSSSSTSWRKGTAMDTCRWLPQSGVGLEHLVIWRHGDSVAAQGVVIGGRNGAEFGASYAISCDTAWRVRHAVIDVAGGGRIELFADGEGRWRAADGAPLDALAGCIDIDLSASCFTNTLPIRRLAASLGSRQVIDVVYISIPELAVETARQAYTRRASKLYRFESVGAGFQADLSVDDDGLVLDYPGLFRRAGPAALPA